VQVALKIGQWLWTNGRSAASVASRQRARTIHAVSRDERRRLPRYEVRGTSTEGASPCGMRSAHALVLPAYGAWRLARQVATVRSEVMFSATLARCRAQHSACRKRYGNMPHMGRHWRDAHQRR